MKDTFDSQRFWKYLVYDVSNAVERQGVSTLILGFMPFLMMCLMLVIHLIFGGSVTDDTTMYRIMPAIVIAVALMIFPGRVWGNVTSRKGGQAWIGIPASAFEKTLSMAVICCVIFPAVIVAALYLSHLLLTLFIPGMESFIFSELGNLVSEDSDGMVVYFGGIQLVYASWCSGILLFALGALVFKKNKVGMTIISLFGLSMVLSLVTLLFLRAFGLEFDGDFAREIEMDPKQALNVINAITNVSFLAVIGATIAGIFFKIKTLKA